MAPRYAPGMPPKQSQSPVAQSIDPRRAYSTAPTIPVNKYANIAVAIAIWTLTPTPKVRIGTNSTPPIPIAPINAPTKTTATEIKPRRTKLKLISLLFESSRGCYQDPCLLLGWTYKPGPQAYSKIFAEPSNFQTGGLGNFIYFYKVVVLIGNGYKPITGTV